MTEKENKHFNDCGFQKSNGKWGDNWFSRFAPAFHTEITFVLVADYDNEKYALLEFDDSSVNIDNFTSDDYSKAKKVVAVFSNFKHPYYFSIAGFYKSGSLFYNLSNLEKLEVIKEQIKQLNDLTDLMLFVKHCSNLIETDYLHELISKLGKNTRQPNEKELDIINELGFCFDDKKNTWGRDAWDYHSQKMRDYYDKSIWVFLYFLEDSRYELFCEYRCKDGGYSSNTHLSKKNETLFDFLNIFFKQTAQ